MNYYRGKLHKYWQEVPESEWEVNELLLNWFNELNEEKFENKLPKPNFLIFSEENKIGAKLNSYGRFQCWSNTQNNKSPKFGIYIAIELYHLDKNEVKTTLLHEMIHLYCWINKLNYNDNSEDFVYYLGWFKCPRSKDREINNVTIEEFENKILKVKENKQGSLAHKSFQGFLEGIKVNE